MKHYQTQWDACFGAILLLTGIASFLILSATAAFQIYTRIVYAEGEYAQPSLWPVYVCFLALLVAILFARRKLLQNNLRFGDCAVLALCTLLAFWVALGWFYSPLHDIALLFDSHGRWGCETIHEDGSHVHFFRSGSAPWLLFTPLMVCILLHSIRLVDIPLRSGRFRV